MSPRAIAELVVSLRRRALIHDQNAIDSDGDLRMRAFNQGMSRAYQNAAGDLEQAAGEFAEEHSGQ